MIENIVNWLRKVKKSEPSNVSLQEKEYKKIAEDALENALSIVESGDWKKEKIVGDDIIYTKVIPKYGKVFKFVVSLYVFIIFKCCL